jgi:hypothetical protein
VVQLVGVALTSVLLASPAAHAFCRTTTCHTCTPTPGVCITTGLPLFWAQSCVSYDLQQDASVQVALPTATQIAALAFSHWQAASCPAANAPPSLTFSDLGPVACDLVEFNQNGSNANIIIFRDTSWDDSNGYDPTSTLALTTVTFNALNGQILAADIEINSQLPLSTTATPTPDAYDLESVLTHEAGHFLGLAHSDLSCDGDDCPTMHASYTAGSIDYRTLKADDIAGLCTVYPPGRTTPAGACLPMGGLSSQCDSASAPATAVDASHGGCTMAPGAPDSRTPLPALLAASALLVGIARVGRRARRPAPPRG